MAERVFGCAVVLRSCAEGHPEAEEAEAELRNAVAAVGNRAVSEILCVDRVYSVSLFGISELIPKIANQIGWQIG